MRRTSWPRAAARRCTNHFGWTNCSPQSTRRLPRREPPRSRIDDAGREVERERGLLQAAAQAADKRCHPAQILRRRPSQKNAEDYHLVQKLKAKVQPEEFGLLP